MEGVNDSNVHLDELLEKMKKGSFTNFFLAEMVDAYMTQEHH